MIAKVVSSSEVSFFSAVEEIKRKYPKPRKKKKKEKPKAKKKGKKEKPKKKKDKKKDKKGKMERKVIGKTKSRK